MSEIHNSASTNHRGGGGGGSEIYDKTYPLSRETNDQKRVHVNLMLNN